MMRKILPSLVAVSVIVLAASLATAGDPKTSLGKWMQNGDGTNNMPNGMTPPAAPDTPDFVMLGKLFAKLVTKEPPAATYPQWDSFLQQGIAATKLSDPVAAKAGVKAACKGCHDTYKKAYIADANSPKPPASYW